MTTFGRGASGWRWISCWISTLEEINLVPQKSHHSSVRDNRKYFFPVRRNTTWTYLSFKAMRIHFLLELTSLFIYLTLTRVELTFMHRDLIICSTLYLVRYRFYYVWTKLLVRHISMGFSRLCQLWVWMLVRFQLKEDGGKLKSFNPEITCQTWLKKMEDNEMCIENKLAFHNVFESPYWSSRFSFSPDSHHSNSHKKKNAS